MLEMNATGVREKLKRKGSFAISQPPPGGKRDCKHPVLEVGSCLQVTGTLPDGVSVRVVLDSGAGVSIVGKQFVEKWEQSYGEMEVRKIEMRVTGVYSGAPLTVKGTATFPLIFEGAKEATPVTAIVVPEWKGELLLGWRTLRNLGIELTLDGPARPVKVRMSRIGAEMEAVETPQDREILAAEALGCSVDRELRKIERKYEIERRKELRRRNREKLTREEEESEEKGCEGGRGRSV